MATVLARNWGYHIAAKRKTEKSRQFFGARKASENKFQIIRGEVSGLAILLVIALFFSGAFYLYQVNKIAIQGYETRDFENRIQELQKESQKLKIREVELKSMYNIEKSLPDLNLVSSSAITYIETNGPMAMR
jgi:hypothetical protein